MVPYHTILLIPTFESFVTKYSLLQYESTEQSDKYQNTKNLRVQTQLHRAVSIVHSISVFFISNHLPALRSNSQRIN